jgi:succinate dehydrogenase assembly factor 2
VPSFKLGLAKIKMLSPRRAFRPLTSQFRVRSLSRTAVLRADPWPLPHTPEHLASTASSDSENPPLPPLPRPNESVSTLRARLVYQSRKRGTLESDLILSTFAREHLGGMSEAELREYDKVRLPFFLRILLVL